ncbi:MAG: tRNA (N(6)-L-threonylcarbamoyladenosine(37)-C(2))-methylthiotransferase MtaB [Chloroflexota bacterium]
MVQDQRNIRVAIDTLGCKLNQAESGLIARKLMSAGYRLVSPSDEADVYILNSCTVTHIADRKSRQALSAVHRRNPDALIIATGCYAERAPHALSRIDGVSVVVGNAGKENLVALLDEYFTGSDCMADNSRSDLLTLRTRAFVKIQDGCNNSCAYCIVPYVRGRAQSLPACRIVAGVKELIAAGYQEIVLTGTEIGSYGDEGVSLQGLVARILRETRVVRLRLSSLQPQEITPELIKLWQDSRLCRHFHLSLQSGSEAVLRRMKRRYTTGDYKQAVSLIKAQLPGAAVTTDVIIGFPGETEAEFAESFCFCRRMPFARIHVFPYSVRPGTEAAGMTRQVGAAVKKERSRQMLTLSRECALNFRRQFIGEVMPVLWEQTSGAGIWSGLTDNYIKVYIKRDADLANRLTEVRLGRIYRDGVWGEITG